ncbi:DoxX family membrane protein [soil metagenome]
MSILRHAARTLLASIFVVDGFDAVKDPYARAEVSSGVAAAIGQRVGPLPEDDPAVMVRANGAVQLGAGLALATGTVSRPAALLLAGSLIPTTLGEHRFWEAEEGQRRQQLRHFLKNVGLLGALVIVALDTEGKPGMAWKTTHAVERANILADHKLELLELRSELAREKAKAATTRVKTSARQARRDAKIGAKAGRSAGRAITSVGRKAGQAVKAVSPL